jgi:Uma2 family endonuclease
MALGLLWVRGTMAAMTSEIPRGEIVETADQRVLMSGISWEHYELLLEARGERPQPHMAYLDGELEIMATSEDHERIKCWLRSLLEVYMLDSGMDFGGYGGYTMKQELQRAGIEPDQCYRIGVDQTRGRWPDLAIEVVWTHGGIDKLEIYRRFGVGEVWFWIDGRIEIYVPCGDRYEPRAASKVVPGIDVSVLASYLDEPLLSTAMRVYRERLRSG